MSANSVFKPWVPNWGIKAVLIFCMLHSMVLLGLYTANMTYSASFLDVEVEDMQYAMSITYGTFLATIMIESRIFKFFPTRNYFMTIYFLAALTFIISGYTHDYVLFIMLRMAEGVLMALPWIPLRMLLLTRFKSKNAIIIVFSLTYGSLLIASPFIMNIVVWLLENYDWKYMAYGSAFFQFLCVALILLTFNGHRFHKKTPLYQVDWASFILFHAAILCGAFVLVYGEKKYWFQSTQIIIATLVTVVTAALFTVRQLLVKRPCFDMAVFRYANLRTGLALFIIFYISRATLNICHSTMSKVWNWEPIRIAHVQYLNAAGNIIGIAIAGVLLSRVVATRYIFILGFSLMAIYHLWFTFLFVSDASLSHIIFPYILQGVAVGILFVPLVLFTVSSVPTPLAPFSGTVGVTGRFLGSTIGFCLMQNLQVYFEQNHRTKLQQFIRPDDPVIQDKMTQYTQNFLGKGFSTSEANTLALQQITRQISKQAMLLSNMEIFTIVGIGLIIIVALILFNQHLRQTFDIFRNKLWGA
ncbi:MAG: MFS transporter [Candidatus Pedobacter colombiensis]|uniref:MFS transporter n=1 Tax=Candidatus Pedobacter colombiensis TaxID=3121371 RepID=A0AAJ5W7U6_9SPHI|nr:MFS transporter [Pedobacter sp.]WEK18599.1 MAG: MFS transporter [Pedobacter sp.]